MANIELQNIKAEWVSYPPMTDEHNNLFEIAKTYGNNSMVKVTLTRAEAKEVARIINEEDCADNKKEEYVKRPIIVVDYAERETNADGQRRTRRNDTALGYLS